MTITMARLARAVALAYRPAPMLALAALLAVPAARAVDLDAVKSSIEALDVAKTSANSWRVMPSIMVQQIYTDNVNHQSDALARSEFLTDLAPSLRVTHKSRRLVLNSQMGLHAYLGADKSAGTRHSSNQLSANAKAELVDDMFFVDADARIFQQSISPFAVLSSGDDYVGTNRANVKTWRLSPYMVNRYGRTARSELRYVRDSVTGGNSGLGDTSGDTLSVRLNSGPAFRDLGWVVSASDQKIRDRVRNDSRIKSASLNLDYQLFPTLALTAAALHDEYDYESLGGAKNGGGGGNAGFRWTPSRRSSLALTLGHRYYGPSRMLAAAHRSRHTVWNLSYDDAIITTRSNFLLAGAVDPATGLPGVGLPGTPTPAPAPLGDLFTPEVPAPPVVVPPLPLPTIPGNINFFSNRFFLQEQLRASVSLRGARTTAVFGAFKVRREALSVRGVDSDILGTPLDTVNDNIDQVGVNATLTYRLAPRTSLNVLANVADNTSLTTGFKARASVLRLGLTHQLSRTMSGAVDLSRSQGVTGVTSGSRYTANAVAASLNLQL